MKVQVLGVGLLGPGLDNWAQGAAALHQGYTAAPTVVPAPQRLPATERRRAGSVVKASIVVADQAVAAAGVQAALLPTVFTSSSGDPLNCHLLCEALAQAQRLVSPTRFTNSVHNVAAGYWHIALQSRAPSTSLAAYDASFAAGLLEATVQCLAAQAPVLLVACDVPYPEPLHALRPLADVFAVALVLSPAAETGAAAGGAAQLELHSSTAALLGPATPCADPALEALRQGNPAARALPLLLALLQAAPARLVLQGVPGHALAVDVRPSSPPRP